MRWLGLVVLFGCEQLTEAPRPALPTVFLETPTNGSALGPSPLLVVGRATTPVGSLVEVAVSLGTSEQRVALNGVDTVFRLELQRPQHLPEPALLRVWATARTDRTIIGPPTIVSLVAEDQLAPALEVALSPGLPATEFDVAYPPGARFSLRVTAQDPALTRIHLDAPRLLGGPRSLAAQAPQDAITWSFSPPLHGDFDLTVWAEDRFGYRSTRALKIRVGDGGQDLTPPLLAAPTRLICGRINTVTATATDLESGMENLRLGQATVWANTATSTLVLSVPIEGLQAVPLRISARNLAGLQQTLTTTLTVIDADPPQLTADLPGPASTGGSLLFSKLNAQDSCGPIAGLQLTWTDARGSQVVTATVSGDPLVGPVSLPVPPNLCLRGPLSGSLVALDASGQPSAPLVWVPELIDGTPPALQLTTDLEVQPNAALNYHLALADAESGLRSATVAVSYQDLVGPLVTPVNFLFAPQSCDDIEIRSGQLALSDELRLGPNAAVVVSAVAEDQSGQQRRESHVLPLVDRVPPVLTVSLPPMARPGQTVTATLTAFDRHRDLDRIVFTTRGPWRFGATRSATISVGAPQATLLISLTVSATVSVAEPLILQVEARDTQVPANRARVRAQIAWCGAPRLASITPSVGPSAGLQQLQLDGSDFIAGTVVYLDTLPLPTNVLSATQLAAQIPPGPHPPGPRTVVVGHDCGVSAAPDAYRFVGAPTVQVLVPEPDQAAVPGEPLPLTVFAQTEGALQNITLGFDQTTLDTRVTTDATLLWDAELTATGTVASLFAQAEDNFGQRSLARVRLGPNVPRRIRVELGPPLLAVGERRPVLVQVETADGRSAPSLALLSSNDPAVAIDGDALSAQNVGTATISITAASLTTTVPVQVVDRALLFPNQPWLLAATATIGPTPQVWLLDSRGLTATVATFSVADPAIATLIGGRLLPQTTGQTELIARLGPLQIRQPLRVSNQLDVPASQRWQVFSGHSFAGGQVVGAVHADGNWRITFTSPATWSGRLHASGATVLILGSTLLWSGEGDLDLGRFVFRGTQLLGDGRLWVGGGSVDLGGRGGENLRIHRTSALGAPAGAITR